MQYSEKYPALRQPNQQVPSSPLAKALMSRYTHEGDVPKGKSDKPRHLSKSLKPGQPGY